MQNPELQPEPLQIHNRDGAESAMAIFTALTLELHHETVQQNAKLLLARKHDEKIEELGKRIGRYQQALVSWAKENRGEFGEGKTLELRQGTISFRDNPPAVELLEGWTEKVVIQKLLKLGRRFKGWLRVRHEIARARILQDCRDERLNVGTKDLARVGLAVVRREAWAVTPKLEDVPIP